MAAKFKRVIGVDLGSYAIKVLQANKGSGGRIAVERASSARVDPTEYVNDPAGALSSALGQAMTGYQMKGSMVVLALPGQSAVIRYPRLPKMPEGELQGAVEIEAGQNIPYDLDDVSLSWVVLEEVPSNGETVLKILLVAAKSDVIESRVNIAADLGVSPHILTVDSLALADAAEAIGVFGGEETVALINLGAAATNIHFCKDGVSNFIRDVTWGGKEITSAIQRTLRISFEDAERLKRDYAESAPAEIPEMAPPAEEAPPAGGDMQMQDPLEEAEEKDDATKIREATAPVISRLVSEVRRSFDYYEQQLYERRADRIVLSGGATEYPTIRKAFMEQLGGSHVETASPLDTVDLAGSDVGPFQDHPSQFMVTVGLVARGIEEL